MNSTDGMMRGIIEEHRDTVGCRNADAHTADGCHHAIYTFQKHLLNRLTKIKELIGYQTKLHAMHLMRKKQTVVIDIQFITERFTVLGNGLRRITTIGIDIELAIITLAHTTVTRRTESRHARTQIVIM